MSDRISKDEHKALLRVACAAKTYRACHWIHANVAELDEALKELENVQPLVEGTLVPSQDVVLLSEGPDKEPFRVVAKIGDE